MVTGGRLGLTSHLEELCSDNSMRGVSGEVSVEEEFVSKDSREAMGGQLEVGTLSPLEIDLYLKRSGHVWQIMITGFQVLQNLKIGVSKMDPEGKGEV